MNQIKSPYRSWDIIVYDMISLALHNHYSLFRIVNCCNPMNFVVLNFS